MGIIAMIFFRLTPLKLQIFSGCALAAGWKLELEDGTWNLEVFVGAETEYHHLSGRSEF